LEPLVRHRLLPALVLPCTLIGCGVLGAAASSAPSPPAARADSASVTYTLKGYANVVRNRPRYHLGKTFMGGSGTVSDTLAGATTTRNEPKHYPDNDMRTEVTAWSYSSSAHGVRKVLVLHVRVAASNDEVDCKVGTVGKVTLVDDARKLSNGQTRDAITHWYPTEDCPSFVQGVTNRRADHLEPREGGPGGGQYAKVKISFRAAS
jgi:hypothetical protein